MPALFLWTDFKFGDFIHFMPPSDAVVSQLKNTPSQIKIRVDILQPIARVIDALIQKLELHRLASPHLLGQITQCYQVANIVHVPQRQILRMVYDLPYLSVLVGTLHVMIKVSSC